MFKFIIIIFEPLVKFLGKFTKDGRFRLTTFIYFLSIFSFSYFVIFKTIYCSYFLPYIGGYYINPSHDLKLFAYEQLWSYRVTFTRIHNWAYIKYCFLTSEGYDFSIGGIYWLVPLKTVWRTLQECYWVYAFHGSQTVWTYKGSISLMHLLNPIVRLPSTLLACFPEFRAYYLDEWMHTGRFHSVLKPFRFQTWKGHLSVKLYDKFYHLLLPNYIREAALETKLYGKEASKLENFLSFYLHSSILNALIYVYNGFSYIVFGVKTIIFAFYTVVISISTFLIYLGVGSLLGYLFYKFINIVFTFYWFYHTYLSGWELKLLEFLPTIIGSTLLFALLAGLLTGIIWGLIVVPLAIVDHILYFHVVCYRIIINFLGRIVIYPLATYYQIYNTVQVLLYYRKNFRVLIWDNTDMLSAWAKKEEDRGTAIISLGEETYFRSKRSGKKLVYVFIPIVVTYILWNYSGWFTSFSAFSVKEFTQHYWKTFYGYPQRFLFDTYWSRELNSNSHASACYDIKSNNWTMLNYIAGKDYADNGQEINYNKKVPKLFLKGPQSPSLENYEFYRFVVVPSFACVLPSLIIIYMSRRLRLVLWPFYDTVSVIFFCMFFFYVFGTLTIGYSFFLRLWFGTIFSELHEGPLYGDIINSNPIDLTGNTKEERTVALYQAIDDGLHHKNNERKFSRYGESYRKDHIPADYYGNVTGYIPKVLPPYEGTGTGYGSESPKGSLNLYKNVELKDHWARTDFWINERIFNTYYHGGTNTGVEGLPHFWLNFKKDLLERQLIYTRAGGMHKHKYMDMIMYRKYYVERNRESFLKRGFPEQYTWAYNTKKNNDIDRYYAWTKIEVAKRKKVSDFFIKFPLISDSVFKKHFESLVEPRMSLIPPPIEKPGIITETLMDVTKYLNIDRLHHHYDNGVRTAFTFNGERVFKINGIYYYDVHSEIVNAYGQLNGWRVSGNFEVITPEIQADQRLMFIALKELDGSPEIEGNMIATLELVEVNRICVERVNKFSAFYDHIGHGFEQPTREEIEAAKIRIINGERVFKF